MPPHDCALLGLADGLRRLHDQWPDGAYLGGLAQLEARIALADHGWHVPKRVLIRSTKVALVTDQAIRLHDVTAPGS